MLFIAHIRSGVHVGVGVFLDGDGERLGVAEGGVAVVGSGDGEGVASRLGGHTVQLAVGVWRNAGGQRTAGDGEGHRVGGTHAVGLDDAVSGERVEVWTLP